MIMYTPYSQRHKITDPDLAGLLDFCEKELGWDITFKWDNEYFWIRDIEKKLLIFKWATSISYWSNEYEGVMQGVTHFDIQTSLFFRTYKTLLPVVRDLYSQ